MTYANRLLEVLYDCRRLYLPGEELAARAGLDARRLKSALAQLAQRGQTVEVSPSHGMRLAAPVAMDAHLIERELGTDRVGRNVICFGEVGSTNDVAFDSARQSGSDGLVVLAESQTKGRGRLGRSWVSPRGANILMSVLLHDGHCELPEEALTISAGVAAAEGIEDSCGVSCQLKWPNDLMHDGAKLGGILVEMRSGAMLMRSVHEHARHKAPKQELQPAGRVLVIGIGVNANASPPRKSVDRPAVCLADASGEQVERIEVVRAILRRLDGWVAKIQQRKLQPLVEEWAQRCEMMNHRLTIQSAGRTYIGRVVAIDPLEGLALCLDNGTTVHLPARTSTVV